VAWWDSAFVQTLTGALAGIAGAFLGAWWSGRAAARTAEADRLQAAEIASLDRLHENRVQTIEQLSQTIGEYTDLYIVCQEHIRLMAGAQETGDVQAFKHADAGFRTAYYPRVTALGARLIDLTVKAALYLEPSSVGRLESSYAGVNGLEQEMLRSVAERAREAGRTPAETMSQVLDVAGDQLERLRQGAAHLQLLVLLLAKASNPGLEKMLDRQASGSEAPPEAGR
jgi:hypothetical protein